jgi:hypothetical protein
MCAGRILESCGRLVEDDDERRIEEDKHTTITVYDVSSWDEPLCSLGLQGVDDI